MGALENMFSKSLRPKYDFNWMLIIILYSGLFLCFVKLMLHFEIHLIPLSLQLKVLFVCDILYWNNT